ncbi:MAG: hypothetical protein COB85_03685 [Bacteroidetes bacterium]|nr:MAG: hypothetical protein COB85_03685 [Bacteroidota bacterium]
MNQLYAITAVILLCSQIGIAQNQHVVDSLKSVIKSDAHDTSKVQALNDLVGQLIYANPDTALLLAKEASILSNKLKYVDGQIISYHNIGYVHYVQSNYDKALANWNITLKLRKEKGDQKGMSASYIWIGNLYQSQSDYAKALASQLKALKIAEGLENKQYMAYCYNNIGVIHKKQSDFPLALEFYFKALKMNEELDDKRGMSACFNNIGIIYNDQQNYPLALEYYFKSYDMDKELGNSQGMALSCNNIGIIYDEQSKYDLAFDFHYEALDLRTQLNDRKGMAASLTNIGNLFSSIYVEIQEDEQNPDGSRLDSLKKSLGQRGTALPNYLDSALHYLKTALELQKQLGTEYDMTFSLVGIAHIHFQKEEYKISLQNYILSAMIADSIGSVKEGSDAYKGIADCYAKLNRYQEALVNHQTYATLKDRTFNEEKSKEIGKLEATHEMAKAETERKRVELESRNVLVEAQHRRDNLQYSGILIFIVLLFASVFFLGRFRIPVKLAEGIIFFTFLLLFEFTLVLLDPYIEQYSSGAAPLIFGFQIGGPAVKLALNAVLAALIFPLHSFFESKFKRRLNKR